MSVETLAFWLMTFILWPSFFGTAGALIYSYVKVREISYRIVINWVATPIAILFFGVSICVWVIFARNRHQTYTEDARVERRKRKADRERLANLKREQEDRDDRIKRILNTVDQDYLRRQADAKKLKSIQAKFGPPVVEATGLVQVEFDDVGTAEQAHLAAVGSLSPGLTSV